MCAEPTNVAARARERLRPPRAEVGATAHRVLELRAVRLDGERGAGRESHGAAEKDVVREHEVGRQQLAHRGGVRLHPALELLPGAVRNATDVVEALVAVEHEDRKETAHVRPHRRGSTEVVHLRPGLLAQHGYVVTGTAPLARERTRVDVGAGAAEEIAVPEQDAHPHILPGPDRCDIR